MNIILINPPAYRQVEEYDLATWQHLGIGRLSSYIRQFGHKTTLIDAKLQKLNIHSILKIIEKTAPDLVGLTAMTPDIYNAYSVSRGVKRLNEKIVTVIGGCHASVMPEATLKEEPSLDYLIAGEGEQTFKELLDEIISPAKPFLSIKGIAFRKDSKIIKTDIRPWNTRLGELPVPDWQLHSFSTHYKLETSRGCPFKCNYCMRVLGETIRYFPIANVLAEFEHIMSLKDNITVEIVDETFTLDHKRLHGLLDGMIKLETRKKIKWLCSTRVNLIDKDLLEKMKKSGCFMICFGVESGNPQVLKRIKKNIELQDVINAVKLTREAGIKSFLSFILGHPDETLKEMSDTVNFISRANPYIASIGTMVPYPGTEVAKIAARGGGSYRLLSTNWSEYNRQFSHVLELNNITKRDMDKLQFIGTLKLFIYNRRFMDLIKFSLQYWRESIHFFKMLSSPDKKISRSKVSFLQLAQIFLKKHA